MSYIHFVNKEQREHNTSAIIYTTKDSVNMLNKHLPRLTYVYGCAKVLFFIDKTVVCKCMPMYKLLFLE